MTGSAASKKQPTFEHFSPANIFTLHWRNDGRWAAGLRSKQASPIGAVFNLARRTTVIAARPQGAPYRPMGSSSAMLFPKVHRWARRDWDTHPAHRTSERKGRTLRADRRLGQYPFVR
jgi:hypothetical protein